MKILKIMERIFRGQAYIIQIDMGQDVTTGSSPVILYKKPFGITGEWVATISVNKLTKEIGNGELNEIGSWQLQGKIKLSGDKNLSDINVLQVNKSLDD